MLWINTLFTLSINPVFPHIKFTWKLKKWKKQEYTFQMVPGATYEERFHA